jgi:hypothetical protein
LEAKQREEEGRERRQLMEDLEKARVQQINGNEDFRGSIQQILLHFKLILEPERLTKDWQNIIGYPFIGKMNTLSAFST